MRGESAGGGGEEVSRGCHKMRTQRGTNGGGGAANLPTVFILISGIVRSCSKMTSL